MSKKYTQQFLLFKAVDTTLYYIILFAYVFVRSGFGFDSSGENSVNIDLNLQLYDIPVLYIITNGIRYFTTKWILWNVDKNE